MDLLESVREKADTDEVERRLEQRRAALIREIENAREAKDWSQAELAEKMGKEPSQITRLLKREANPTLRTLVEFEAALARELFTVNSNIKYKLKDRHLGEGQIVTSQTQKHGSVPAGTHRSIRNRAREGDLAGNYEDVLGEITTDNKHNSGTA
jgi:transcriptional regulator with XRE-family HTH domain